MAPPLRRSVPDNLDPLVDTLSNVVGILVIVVALTQIQLGDALARVVELDAKRAQQEGVLASLPAQVDLLEQRHDAILRRTDRDLEEAAPLAREMLAALSRLPTLDDERDVVSLEALEEERAIANRTLEESRRALVDRGEYIERLERVPKQMVARLPDPKVETGKESWILVRYGRVFLVDREVLFDEGESAIGRVLGQIVVDGAPRIVRRDEFESIAQYLRKRETGSGPFRWFLRTEPEIRVELAWRSKETGIEYGELETSPALRRWLARRSPDVDLIRFQVWADSFEAYLTAREVIETAGFRAGWRGHEIDEELGLPIRFGVRDPVTRPVPID